MRIEREGKDETERAYMLWLCSLPGIGNVRGERLLNLCGGSARNLYHAPGELWSKVVGEKTYEKVKEFTEGWKVQEEYEKLREKGIGFVCRCEDTYPERLRNIPDAPLGLFYRGSLPKQDVPSAAVIGARDCSEYGSYVARELGRFLGERGVNVISGMARGIDGICQSAALERGGASFGVLGCGVDICYPRENRRLYIQLSSQGGLLSSYVPGTEPRPGNFPPRNRIVSGLADAVVVVEARNKSGTLITVDMALEQGKEVYVVPGRITDRLSDGCNSLLRQGARVFLSPEDFWEELSRDFHRKNPKYALRERRVEGGKKERELAPELQQIWEALDFTPRTLEQIKDRISFSCSVGSLGAMLMILCMKGFASQVSPGYFCAAKR